MKILHINSNYLCTRLHSELIDKISNDQFLHTVYSPVYKGQLKVLKATDNVIESRCIKKTDRICFRNKSRKIFNDVESKVNAKDYNIIHAHTLFTDGYIAYKLYVKYGISYIVTVRNTDLNIFFKYMKHLNKLGIKILKSANKIVFLSESYKELTFKKYIPKPIRNEILNKVEVIPNGIDDFWIRNLETKPKHKIGYKLELLYVGVVNKNKNITSTVKAIEILINKGYDINFTIVGRIADNKVYNKIKQKKYINYINPMSKEELINIYRRCDIFIMPSIHETFGLVYAEAMSQGLPVIYTRGQGFDSQFEDGEVGYSVDPKDISDIARKIVRVKEENDKLSNNCIKNVCKFNWNEIGKNYINIYNTL